MIQEHPGLLSSGFNSVGKYGIGFFSVFMWGEKVQVTSRSIKKGPEDTNMLLFGGGLNNRPVLLKCKSNEQFEEAGTRVRIYCEIDNLLVEMSKSIESSYDTKIELNKTEQLLFICRRIAPCLNVDLLCQIDMKSEINVLKGGDWKNINSRDLLLRISGYSEENCPEELKPMIEDGSMRLSDAVDDQGNILGRASIDQNYSPYKLGVLVCGGLYVCEIQHISGVFSGEINSASRLRGVPLIEDGDLKNWANRQTSIIQEDKSEVGLYKNERVAELINMFGGGTGDLPICYSKSGALSYQQVKEFVWQDEVYLINSYEKNTAIIKDDAIPVIYTQNHSSHVLFGWPDREGNYEEYTLRYLVIRAIAESWGYSLKSVLENSSVFSKRTEPRPFVLGTNVHNEEVKILVDIIRKPII